MVQAQRINAQTGMIILALYLNMRVDSHVSPGAPSACGVADLQFQDTAAVADTQVDADIQHGIHKDEAMQFQSFEEVLQGVAAIDVSVIFVIELIYVDAHVSQKCVQDPPASGNNA